MNLEYHLYRIIGTMPTCIMIVVGIILAVRNYRTHPRTCGVLLLALLLDGCATLLLPIGLQTVTTTLQQLGLFNSMNQPGLWALIWTLPYSLVSALIWGLILYAIFDRPAPPKFPEEEDRDRDLLDS